MEDNVACKTQNVRRLCIVGMWDIIEFFNSIPVRLTLIVGEQY